jgi:tRNA 2-selenouridine synthase
MYRYQLEKHTERRFLHVGDWDSCLEFARAWSQQQRDGVAN